MQQPLTVTVTLDSKTFMRFAVFDGLARTRRWMQPLIFFGLMAGFASVCFFAFRHIPQSALLGTVLLAIGILLPAAYFGKFFSALKAQAKKQALPRAVYEVTLGNRAEGVFVRSLTADEKTTLRWDKLHAAYRVKGCVYLYSLPARAFLLPFSDEAEGDALWARITENMPAKRCFAR